MTGEAEEFASRGHIGSPYRFRRTSLHILEMDIDSGMFEDFAFAWCRNSRIIDLLSFKLRIVGYFSHRHPMSYDRQDVTIYLERIH